MLWCVGKVLLFYWCRVYSAGDVVTCVKVFFLFYQCIDVSIFLASAPPPPSPPAREERASALACAPLHLPFCWEKKGSENKKVDSEIGLRVGPLNEGWNGFALNGLEIWETGV